MEPSTTHVDGFMERTVRRLSARTHMRLCRNHFSGDSRAVSVPTIGFFENRGGNILRNEKPLQASLSAAQRMRTYRFAIVNSVFNPRKVILGDDPARLAGRPRDWL